MEKGIDDKLKAVEAKVDQVEKKSMLAKEKLDIQKHELDKIKLANESRATAINELQQTIHSQSDIDESISAAK